MKPHRLAKNTLIKIIAIWVILGVVGGISFNVYKRIKNMPLSAEVEEEVAFAYGVPEVEDSNPFEEYLDEAYRYGLHRMKEEEYLEELEEEPNAPKSTVYPSDKGEIPNQSKPTVTSTSKPKDDRKRPIVISQFKEPHFGHIKVIEIEDSEPIVAMSTPQVTPWLTEPVLVSLITTIGATLNTLLLVFKRKS